MNISYQTYHCVIIICSNFPTNETQEMKTEDYEIWIRIQNIFGLFARLPNTKQEQIANENKWINCVFSSKCLAHCIVLEWLLESKIKANHESFSHQDRLVWNLANHSCEIVRLALWKSSTSLILNGSTLNPIQWANTIQNAFHCSMHRHQYIFEFANGCN